MVLSRSEFPSGGRPVLAWALDGVLRPLWRLSGPGPLRTAEASAEEARTGPRGGFVCGSVCVYSGRGAADVARACPVALGWQIPVCIKFCTQKNKLRTIGKGRSTVRHFWEVPLDQWQSQRAPVQRPLRNATNTSAPATKNLALQLATVAAVPSRFGVLALRIPRTEQRLDLAHGAIPMHKCAGRLVSC